MDFCLKYLEMAIIWRLSWLGAVLAALHNIEVFFFLKKKKIDL